MGLEGESVYERPDEMGKEDDDILQGSRLLGSHCPKGARRTIMPLSST